MSHISPAQLKSLLDQDASIAVIDVRTPLEFDEVHVPEARSIPLDALAPKRRIENGELPAKEPIYILCHSGARAQKAADQFQAAGYENTVVVEGGTQAWINANLPVIRGEAKVISLERQVRIAAGALVFTGVALGWFVHPGFFGLSAFVGAGLVFAGITDWCGMGLLIAKAPWNQRSSS
ncbi:rhodanese-like domain-containing protein [Luteolibacter arcticus]|uniref:Rhodanese-like domain-containing protein n=1 Tax=Luteolibacter arcticus TaxID=1581411 RepID=A0ABT3GHY4_9BACT|nr:rhodanese-like domain-containing protein [Luteolibacter arcticus]MCW1923117.1 rhodanese-like domain-containing protein [Luteolibacter arcticus]